VGFGVWYGLGELWFGGGGLLLEMYMSIVVRPFWENRVRGGRIAGVSLGWSRSRQEVVR
jgi:hypothetical protein